MAYTPCYPNRINWQNDPSEATALNDVNLNKMDSAINTIDGRVVDMSTRLDTDDTAITNLQGNVSNLQSDMTTAQGNITALQNGKVDKVTGQGLSKTNDVQVTSSTNVGTKIATVQIFPSTGGVSGVQIKNGVVVDDALSSSSENPVQNKVVKSAIDEKSTVAISDTLATGTTLANITIDGTTTAIKGSDIEVDEELSPTSANPVENKAIYDALNNLLPSKTVSGNPISISDASGFNAKALTVSMNPIQDLHGYSNPWAGGAGVNKLSAPTDGSNSNNGVTVSVVGGVYTLSGSATGRSANITFNLAEPYTIKDGDYLHLLNTVARDSSVITLQRQNGTAISAPGCTPINRIFNLSTSAGETIYSVRFYIANGTQTDFKMSLMIVNSSTATSYAPYSNICPISGRTEASVTRTAGEDVETHTHQYGQTVYGGVDDFVNGGLSNEWGYIASYDGETLPGEWVSDRDVYAPDTTPTTGAEVAYKLSTPTTISTSAENISLLKGNNVVSTNADNMELKYSVSLDSLLI